MEILQRPITRRRFLAAAGATAGTALLASCSGGGSGSSSAKNLVGTEWGGIWDKTLKAMTPQVKSATGIDATYGIYSSANSLALIEQNKGQYDFSWLIPSDAALGMKQGLLQPIDTSRVTAWSDVYPMLRQTLQTNGKAYGAPVSWGVSGILWRPDKVPFEIKSWQDLWRPELKNSIALQAPPSSGGLIVLLAASLIYGSGIKDTAAGWKAMARLKPNVQFFYSISSDPINKLVDGSLPVAVTFADFGPPLASKGVRTTVPTEGSDSGPQLITIPSAANSDHLSAVYDYINYFLSPSAQVSWAKGNEVAAANSKVTLPKSVTKDLVEDSAIAKHLWDIDYLWFGQQTQAWTKKWNEVLG